MTTTTIVFPSYPQLCGVLGFVGTLDFMCLNFGGSTSIWLLVDGRDWIVESVRIKRNVLKKVAFTGMEIISLIPNIVKIMMESEVLK
jgi:hypothetical protein